MREQYGGHGYYCHIARHVTTWLPHVGYIVIYANVTDIVTKNGHTMTHHHVVVATLVTSSHGIGDIT